MDQRTEPAQYPQAEYSRKYRAGVAHQLREIRQELAELRVLLAARAQPSKQQEHRNAS
jgi:ribosomal protein L29